MYRCKIKLVIFWFTFFTTSFALSQTYTFSHKTITKIKFIGNATWEEEIVFSNPKKNYLIAFTILPNIFQVNVRDYDNMKHHYFDGQIESQTKDTVLITKAL